MDLERKADNHHDAEPTRGSERRAVSSPNVDRSRRCREIERGSLEERCPSYGGTEGSNPSRSSAESSSILDTSAATGLALQLEGVK